MNRIPVVIAISILFAACNPSSDPQAEKPASPDASKIPSDKDDSIRTVAFNGANGLWRGAMPLADAENLESGKMFETRVFTKNDNIPTHELLLGRGYKSISGEAGNYCVQYDPDNDATEVTTLTGSPTQAGGHLE